MLEDEMVEASVPVVDMISVIAIMEFVYQDASRIMRCVDWHGIFPAQVPG